MDGGRRGRPQSITVFILCQQCSQNYTKEVLKLYGGGQKMGSTKTRHLAIREKIMTNS